MNSGSKENNNHKGQMDLICIKGGIAFVMHKKAKRPVELKRPNGLVDIERPNGLTWPSLAKAQDI